MPPRGRKHWCKLCKKSFPSCNSLGGHMNLAIRDKCMQKKLARSTLSLPKISAGAGGYRLRERQHSTWLLRDSSVDEDQTMVPKTECQLCFKVFASCHALSMHMRAHTRHEKKMVAKEASRKSSGYCDHNDAVPTPVMLTYGIEEVNAARVLLMISGHSGMDSASEHCNEDYEMDGNSAYRMQKNERELDYSFHGQIGGADLMMPESPSSDAKLKFSSLSRVLKATESHDCKLCGKVFTSSKGLASHKKFHKADSRLLCLNLPVTQFSVLIPRSPKSEQNPWWIASGLLSDRVLGVV
uniref:C2H2-type domain-containing protein n=1 Tax=Setaria italica TaxID=4555 RepID=K4AD82_SETIT